MMPTLFLGHGSPMLALEDNELTQNFHKLGERMPEIKGVLSLSAHWFTRGQRLQLTQNPRQIYDMYGFPQALYELVYPAQGSQELSLRVKELLGEGVQFDDSWGIDHGSWSVLHHLFPGAPYPVVQLSIDASAEPKDLFGVGEKLRPLREEGWLILGSGNIVHNLRLAQMTRSDGDPRADAFDLWVKDCVLNRDFEALSKYREWPEADFSVPTTDHFYPLLYVLGASLPGDRIEVFNEVRMMGSISMTSYLFGLE